MLPRLEPECIGQLVRHVEADRHRLVGLGHDFRHPQHMKMFGHSYQRAPG